MQRFVEVCNLLRLEDLLQKGLEVGCEKLGNRLKMLVELLENLDCKEVFETKGLKVCLKILKVGFLLLMITYVKLLKHSHLKNKKSLDLMDVKVNRNQKVKL